MFSDAKHEVATLRPSRLIVAAMALAALALPASVAADPVPLAQFGAGMPGAAAGEVSSPTGIAVDRDGDLYVAEFTNNRVSVFSPAGGFLRAFGMDVVPGNSDTGPEICRASCKAGVASGEAGGLATPHGLAFDPAGNLHVADRDNGRISVFTPAGEFVRAFGFDVDPGGASGFEFCTTSCQPAEFSSGGGALLAPIGVAFDPAGNLYVSDEGFDRISVFSSQPAFVRAFGQDVVPGGSPVDFEVCTTNCQSGRRSDESGALSGPHGLAFDPAGNLYVADHVNDRISVFSPAPAFLRAFGGGVVPGDPNDVFEVCTTSCTSGEGIGFAGDVHSASGVAFDAAGNLHVADSLNNRVTVFTTLPAPVHAYGRDVAPGNGELGFELCAAACQEGVEGTGPGELSSPFMAASDCRGAIYVSDQDNHRVQRFGEPGTPPPPCAGGDDPSNKFSFGKVKRNKRNGTAKLTVIVPGPGELGLARTNRVRRASEDADAAGEARLRIRARGKALERLELTGTVRVRARVTYTPTGGEPNTKSKRLRLRQDLG